MSKKTVVGILSLMLIGEALPGVCIAQNHACPPPAPNASHVHDTCGITEMDTFYPAPLPVGWYYTGNLYNWGLPEIAIKTCCPPLPNPCPTCSNNKGGAPSAGAPIWLSNGNTFISERDLSLPGLGGGLQLSRTWNSVWPSVVAQYSVGIFGPNWRSTYEEVVFMGSDNYLKYLRSDGQFWSFALNPAAGLVTVSPSNAQAALIQTATNLTLSFQNGEQRQFNLSTGQLTAIIDRNGNTTQLTYNGSNQLVTVTSPASQHLYFNYGTGALSRLVTSVTSDFGVTFSYSYDPEGRLVQVTKPDSTTVSFTYNSQSQITSVTDNNGLVLESHTYDSSSRGLTSSQANGVNAVTVTYPQ